MKHRFLFLPFGALVVFAAYLGWQRGQVPSETEIIDHYAAIYLDMAGPDAQPTNCAAVPHPAPDIRMVITCSHPIGTVTTFHVGLRGESLPEPGGPGA